MIVFCIAHTLKLHESQINGVQYLARVLFDMGDGLSQRGNHYVVAPNERDNIVDEKT